MRRKRPRRIQEFVLSFESASNHDVTGQQCTQSAHGKQNVSTEASGPRHRARDLRHYSPTTARSDLRCNLKKMTTRNSVIKKRMTAAAAASSIC